MAQRQFPTCVDGNMGIKQYGIRIGMRSIGTPYWGLLFLVAEPNLTSHIEQIFLQAFTGGGWSNEFPTYFMQGKQ